MAMMQCSGALYVGTYVARCVRTDHHSGTSHSGASVDMQDANSHRAADGVSWTDRNPYAVRLKLRPGDQPLPEQRPDQPAIQDLVIADIEARKQIGMQRYGSLLRAGNGRDALQDAYEECLDMLCYLKQEIIERAERR